MIQFRIADTFTESLTKLSNDEQKAAKTTAFDLQMDPSNPGMKFHKLDRAKDKRFWSVRVSSDLRLIVHRTDTSLMLCYVDHHDSAYRWAERRKLETHPRTGAAQLVEIREMVEEVVVPRYVTERRFEDKSPVLASFSEEDLLRYGVPPEWLGEVREANEDTLLDLVEHLPSEAAEALLELAVGAEPQITVTTDEDPFKHPDAQRRFRVMSNVEELKLALEYPWEKWTIFLHPTQRQLVEGDYNGPARISGSAGTGKTIVALHRAVHLARNNPDARVLLTTFSDALAKVLITKLKRLASNEPRITERLEVQSIDTIGRRLFELNVGKLNIAHKDDIIKFILEATRETNTNKFSSHFLMSEWNDVIDAWQIETWEAYRDILRLGRKTRLPEKQRAQIWSIFKLVRSKIKTQGLVTPSDIFNQLANKFAISKNSPFDFIVVDEAQDISVAQLRFLAALGKGQPNSLFFTGDLGQRIFQQPFSWKALGIDIKGRSKTLRVNYRTSHQIRIQADKLLAPEVSDVDGNTEKRKGTISIFNGPKPVVVVLKTPDAEIKKISHWLIQRMKEDVKPYEIGVFVRSPAELGRAAEAVKMAGLPYKILDENVDINRDSVSICTMHLAKGLEFRAVSVMACDDEVIPLQERIEAVADDTDLEEVYNTERHLLYVACTRARDNLIVTGVEPASEFLDDLSSEGTQN